MKSLLVFLLLISTVVFVFTPSLDAQAPTAVIKEMTGTVELQRAGSTNWVPASVGARIEADTIVSTGFKSTAVLTVGSSTLTVRPITRLSLKELTAANETETTRIALNTGRVRAEVNPPAGGRANFSVQTPTATASVRGTTFEMDPTSINVLTGAVSFAPTGSETHAVTVSAGQTTEVDTETGTTLAPIIAAEAERTLPSLPGQSAGVATITDSGSRPEVSRGSLEFTVELKPKSPATGNN